MKKYRTLLRQLKWRIVATHMVVVIVGVAMVLLAARVLTMTVVPADVEAQAARLAQAADAAALAQATADLLDTFRSSIFTAVLLAALAAIAAGVLTSLLLAREILRPLRQIAASSQRIARGHYNERIPEPGSDELSAVTTSFNQMAESLAQVEQQRIALIGNVSHELRTPLAGLNGYLEGLMDGVFPNNDETFALMHQEIHRLRRLVDDLQSLSRVEAGQLSFNFQRFDLILLLQRVMAQLRPQAAAECLEMIAEHHAETLFVYADPDRTAQVLLNLIGNAIRYTPAEGCITVRTTSTSHQAQVEITDNGQGIPVEALPYIFERFYRVDRSRTRQSGGSGIGLTISRHLIWSMGGEISVRSDGLGLGSTFTFTLPLADS